ncbi:hypothetical protein [Pseudomonas putida]|uniref:Uncharacterized protein n=1 Tax=Pseudomonas putida TaxID=303 RepID=A0A8I1EBS2_PSEPU|nr:hypothetical protein [Pseudomonas putida]MBI6882611.1 hypothetical protein [Pseudomonas putida]
MTAVCTELKAGDKVTHIRDDDAVGFVIEVDAGHETFDTTTCRVVWGVETYEEAKQVPRDDQDIQWTNKLALVAEAGN